MHSAIGVLHSGPDKEHNLQHTYFTTAEDVKAQNEHFWGFTVLIWVYKHFWEFMMGGDYCAPLLAAG
jgi:hypothetical protein